MQGQGVAGASKYYDKCFNAGEIVKVPRTNAVILPPKEVIARDVNYFYLREVSRESTIKFSHSGHTPTSKPPSKLQRYLAALIYKLSNIYIQKVLNFNEEAYCNIKVHKKI